MSSKNNTLSAEQQKLMEIISQASAALAALSAGAPAPKKGGRKTKSTSSADAEPKEKKPLNPKIAAMNEERMAIFAEMKSAWFAANPSGEGLDPKERSARIKKGELPPFPTFPEALKEHSRRMRAADPEHDKKAQAYRDRVDAKQAEAKKEKKVFKVKSAAPPPPPKAEPEVIVREESDDPEFFNMDLKIGDEVLQLNGLNWVLNAENDWVGLWNPETKELDRSAPMPEDD
jgi:hypothetical protein